MATPEVSLIPFDTLPACAKLCGTLFDVNGKCTPPGNPGATDEEQKTCFCSDDRLTPFLQGISGVCEPPCTGSDTRDATLQAIQEWYGSFCNVQVAADGTNNGGTTANTAGSSAKAKSEGGGDWLSSHWQWVVMLVIMVVGIAGIWIGACFWRRHYLKKKERAHALGKHAPRSSAVTASWGPGAAPPDGVFMSSANNGPAPTEKKTKRVSKWVPKERT